MNVVVLLVPVAYGLFWLTKRKNLIAAGRLVAITGCDSGLGYSIAVHCHMQGFTVLAMVLEEQSSGAQALRQLGKVRQGNR